MTFRAQFLLPVYFTLACVSSAQSYSGSTYVSGLTSPIAVVQDPAKRNVQYIVEQAGLIRIVKDGVLIPTPFLDLTGVVLLGSEQGLLGLAFPKDYASTGAFYVNMTVPGPVMQVSQYHVSADPMVADSGSRHDVLQTPRQNGNHNAGTIQFGPEGFLYIPMGDGGGSGDQTGNGQNPATWLGKMLRIDPVGDDFPFDNTRNYRVPASNPFVNNPPMNALKEIWAFGLRNPFKFSFDDPNLLGTGAMLIGDVGQDDWEEVDFQPAGRGGNNYGWRRFEGFSLFSASSSLAYGPDTRPAYVYNHATGVTVIGGRVYRGLELGADAFGRYFFADFSNGRIWSMTFKFDLALNRWTGIDLKEHTSEIGSSRLGSIVSIDSDSSGELFVLDYNGKVTRLFRTNMTWLKEFTVQGGRIASGAIRHVVALDNQPLQLETQTPQSKSMVVSFFGRSNVAARNALDIDAVGQLSVRTGLLRLSLRRWSDNQFVQVSAQNMDTTKRRFRLTGLSATDYVRAGDGRIELKLDVQRAGTTEGLVRCLWDQITMKVR